MFVDATTDERVPIESMPGHERVPIEEAVDRVEEVLETGVEAVMLFGIPESKDERGSRAWAEDGVVQKATRRVTEETEAYVITDVCMCEYTSHGHCGIVEDHAEDPTLTVKNDETLALLAKTAVSHAEAGADMVAPSSMTDGMVGAIREALDDGTRAFRSCPTPQSTRARFTARSVTPPTARPRSVTGDTTRWTPQTPGRLSAR